MMLSISLRKHCEKKIKEKEPSYFNDQNVNSLCSSHYSFAWVITVNVTALTSSVFPLRYRSTSFSTERFLTPHIKSDIIEFPLLMWDYIFHYWAFFTLPFVSRFLFVTCNLIRSATHLAFKSSSVLLVVSICLGLRLMSSLCNEDTIKKYWNIYLETFSGLHLYHFF